MNPRVELRIGELGLHGFPPLAGSRVVAEAERHLAALIAQGGLHGVERYSGRARVRGGQVAVPRRAGPTEIGQAVARSVYEGLHP